jgi:hypothetical protein
MRSQGTWQRGGLALLFLLTLLLAPSAATFAQATGATDPDGGTGDATATIVSCAPWGGTYGNSSETRTGCFIQRNGSGFRMPWLIQDDNSIYNANYVMKGTNFIPMGGDEGGGWHGWNMWTYLDPNYPDTYGIRNLIYNRDLDKARLVRSNVIRIFLNVDQWGGVPNIYGQYIPFNTRLLTALDQFLWQANEWDMKVIVTFYDGLNTPTPWCTGKLGNRNNPGWSEAQPYLEHVQRIVDYFKNDVRIAAWDVMNEPDHLSRMRAPCPNNTMYDMGWLTGWMQRVISEIRSRDTKHPVTVGLYGYFVNRFTGAINTTEYNDLFHTLDQGGQGNAFVGFHWYGSEDHNCNIYPSCQSSFQNALAGLRSATGMPVVVGEIGLADSGAGNPWDRTYLEQWTRAWTDVASQYADGALAWINTDFRRTASVVCSGLQSSNECFFGMVDINTNLKPAGVAFRDRFYNCTTPYIRIKTAHGRYATSLGDWQELNQSTSSPTSSNLFVMDPNLHRFLFYLKPTSSGQYVKAFGTSNEHLQLQPLTGDTFPWRFYHIPMSKRLTSGSQSYFEFAFKPRNNVYIHADPPAWGGSLGYSRKWIGPWETFRMECFNSLGSEDPSAPQGAN